MQVELDFSPRQKLQDALQTARRLERLPGAEPSVLGLFASTMLGERTAEDDARYEALLSEPAGEGSAPVRMARAMSRACCAGLLDRPVEGHLEAALEAAEATLSSGERDWVEPERAASILVAAAAWLGRGDLQDILRKRMLLGPRPIHPRADFAALEMAHLKGHWSARPVALAVLAGACAGWPFSDGRLGVAHILERVGPGGLRAALAEVEEDLWPEDGMSPRVRIPSVTWQMRKRTLSCHVEVAGGGGPVRAWPALLGPAYGIVEPLDRFVRGEPARGEVSGARSKAALRDLLGTPGAQVRLEYRATGEASLEPAMQAPAQEILARTQAWLRARHGEAFGAELTFALAR